MEPKRRSSRVGTIVLILAGLSTGCASSGGTPKTVEPGADRDRYEASCDLALTELERLIARRSADDDFPGADLVEAQELYRAGRELYLEREYALALEVIEEGIQLLKEPSH